LRLTFQTLVRCVAAALFVGVILPFAAPSARAQKGAAAGPTTFGSVDVGQILNESKARQRDVAELNDLVASLRGVMQQLQDGGARFLTDAQIKTLAGLYEKKNPTEGDKKAISDLEGQAAAKSADKRRLENTANPTDEQKKQYSDLTDAEQKGQQALKNLNDEFAKRVDARDVELSNKTVASIKSIIAKVAQDKGISVVFDSKVAIYTANDITADVIKQLNK
jgi:Skp family chaperone for outer membrane proteins